jgi:hypothetical protein
MAYISASRRYRYQSRKSKARKTHWHRQAIFFMISVTQIGLWSVLHHLRDSSTTAVPSFKVAAATESAWNTSKVLKQWFLVTVTISRRGSLS